MARKAMRKAQGSGSIRQRPDKRWEAGFMHIIGKMQITQTGKFVVLAPASQ